MAAKTYRGNVLKIYKTSHSKTKILINLHFTAIRLKETAFEKNTNKHHAW